jgi:hypothetical protein
MQAADSGFRRNVCMDPQAALEQQIAMYRAMTGEERLLTALRLHEISCEIARAGIRDRYPQASPEEVEQHLRARIQMVYAHART